MRNFRRDQQQSKAGNGVHLEFSLDTSLHVLSLRLRNDCAIYKPVIKFISKYCIKNVKWCDRPQQFGLKDTFSPAGKFQLHTILSEDHMILPIRSIFYATPQPYCLTRPASNKMSSRAHGRWTNKSSCMRVDHIISKALWIKQTGKLQTCMKLICNHEAVGRVNSRIQQIQGHFCIRFQSICRFQRTPPFKCISNVHSNPYAVC